MTTPRVTPVPHEGSGPHAPVRRYRPLEPGDVCRDMSGRLRLVVSVDKSPISCATERLVHAMWLNEDGSAPNPFTTEHGTASWPNGSAGEGVWEDSLTLIVALDDAA